MRWMMFSVREMKDLIHIMDEYPLGEDEPEPQEHIELRDQVNRAKECKEALIANM